MHKTLPPSLLAALLLLPLAVHADDDEDEDEGHDRRAAVTPAAKPAAVPAGAAGLYRSECGSCHFAFQPRLLPALSWTAVLDGLAHHFGVNAEVDAATRQTLEAYLRAGAGRPRPGPTLLRITEQRWWLHEHDELSAAVFARPAVAKASNCAACHLDADQGAFRERAVRIPP